jgi:hypothetical protein
MEIYGKIKVYFVGVCGKQDFGKKSAGKGFQERG